MQQPTDVSPSWLLGRKAITLLRPRFAAPLEDELSRDPAVVRLPQRLRAGWRRRRERPRALPPAVWPGLDSELETSADVHHWPTPRVDRGDDLLDIDSLQVDARRGRVGMPQLTPDDQQRHANPSAATLRSYQTTACARLLMTGSRAPSKRRTRRSGSDDRPRAHCWSGRVSTARSPTSLPSWNATACTSYDAETAGSTRQCGREEVGRPRPSSAVSQIRAGRKHPSDSLAHGTTVLHVVHLDSLSKPGVGPFPTGPLNARPAAAFDSVRRYGLLLQSRGTSGRALELRDECLSVQRPGVKSGALTFLGGGVSVRFCDLAVVVFRGGVVWSRCARAPRLISVRDLGLAPGR